MVHLLTLALKLKSLLQKPAFPGLSNPPKSVVLGIPFVPPGRPLITTVEKTLSILQEAKFGDFEEVTWSETGLQMEIDLLEIEEGEKHCSAFFVIQAV
uniref:SERPIN domain-containing protein n=1 Tax=Steinernema glaseri TaxID=37863 RepID=A0A1I7Y391_9BILA